MNSIPKDPVMLVSYLNTRLRDYDRTLDELCGALNLDKEELSLKLEHAGFEYNEKSGQFI